MAKRSKKKEFHAPRTMPAIMRVLLSVVLLIGAALAFTWFILWQTNLCDLDATEAFIEGHQNHVAYSGLIIFCVMAVIAAATWRPFFTVGLSFSLISIITFINTQKFQLRGLPLLPDDLALIDQTGTIASFVEPWEIAKLIIGIVLVLAGCILLEHCAKRTLGRDRRELAWWDKMALIPRATFTMSALAGLAVIASPIMNHEVPRWFNNVEYVGWHQARNYEYNGFVIGTLYNLGQLAMPEPEGYSYERIQEIAEKYKAIKATDESRKALSEIADNVIIVLDETFYDPELFTKYYAHTGGDVIPNVRKAIQKYPGGYMYSPEYGGGTANIEFQTYTGLTNYWAPGSFPYLTSVPQSAGMSSIASFAKDNGYDTTGIHSYDGNMYKRYLVYPLLGFDTFLDQDTMKFTEVNYSQPYISDQSVYREILDIVKSNDDPQLVTAVTMQNHRPYEWDVYPQLDFVVEDNHELELSYQRMHQTDQYLGEFLAELDKLDEKTVVLWYGDHTAGILDDYSNSSNKSERDLVHLTPYFVYANFDIESPYTEEEVARKNEAAGFKLPAKAKGVNLPVVSPNCLQNMMFNILGAEKPALFYLLDEVCSGTPILAQSYLAGEAPESEALKEYELINYDILAGKEYWEE